MSRAVSEVKDPSRALSEYIDTAIAFLERGNEKAALTILKDDIRPKIKSMESGTVNYAYYFLWAAVLAAIFISLTGILLIYIQTKLRKLSAQQPQ